MTFYESYSFFVLLAVAGCAMAALKRFGKDTALAGLGISAGFVGLMLYRDMAQLGALCGFVALQWANMRLFLRQRRKEKRRGAFYVAAAVSLLPLVLFKLTDAFHVGIMGFLGISYITFRAVQVILEIQDGLILEMRSVDYLYFLLFFPTFTAGPIDRSRRFVEDIHRTQEMEAYLQMAAKGVYYLLLGGLYQMVIGALMMRVHTELKLPMRPILHQGAYLVKELYSYGLYLYFNFAGYSLMAVGAGYCLGIDVPMNFNRPYLSLDMKEFWDRWHMSLSTWLRDYVFTRFSMLAMKKKWFKTRLLVANAGYMVNMLIMGLWHGLTLNYICYGAYHGALLVLTDLWQKKAPWHRRWKANRLYRFLCWALTMHLVLLGFQIFEG